MASSLVTVDGYSLTPDPVTGDTGRNVIGGDLVTIQLIDLTDVRQWSITCYSTDYQNDAVAITTSLSVNNVTKTATFTMPSMVAGSALLFKSIVNSGVDSNGIKKSSYTYTFGIYALGPSGIRLISANEKYESNLLFAWTKSIDQVISLSGGSVSIGGDLGGTSISPLVIGIQGNDVKSETLSASQDGYTLTWVNSNSRYEAKPTTIASITMSGDVTGSSNSNTVVNIHGASVPTAGSLTTGNVLKVSGTSALTYGAVNLAGGTNHVTGILPRGNQQSQTLGGDASGDTSAVVNEKVHGATVPISGALTTGNILQVTGVSALSYAALNLAGGSNFVTGSLPTANQVSQSLGGDLSGTTNSATVVNINGSSVPAGGSLTTGTVLRATGTSSLAYGALDLANTNAVTGVLPRGNQQSQTMAGDVTGNTAASVVAKANGATVPTAGSLTTGNVLQVTGTSALSYAAVNLAGGANFVTGSLPTANQASQTMAGDVTGTTAVSVVAKVNGTSVPVTPAANTVLAATSGTTAVWSKIVDGYVATNAAIAGSKINPQFGSQLLTAGQIIVGLPGSFNAISGGMAYGGIRTITGNLTIDTSSIADYLIFCNFSSGATITLTSVASGLGGRMLIIKDIGGNFATNNLTITPNGSDTIDGSNASLVFTSDYGVLTMISDGATAWWTI